MRIDTVITDVRVFPLLDISREQLEQAAGAPIVAVERIDGGLTNTIHKVTLEDGDVLGIKHYAGGRDWFETELTTLTLLHGWVRIALLVPTLYLGAFVWENVMLAKPEPTRYVVLGAILVAVMVVRPNGLLGEKRVEII